jgi:hypothetical protein
MMLGRKDPLAVQKGVTVGGEIEGVRLARKEKEE